VHEIFLNPTKHLSFYKIGRVYRTINYPGVKGWHFHRMQTDFSTRVNGRINQMNHEFPGVLQLLDPIGILNAVRR
jgi:hypothetical protein